VRRLLFIGLTLLGTVFLAAPARAQRADRSRLELSGGIRWIGPVDFGGVRANETTLGGGTRSLFASDTTLDGSLGATGIVGVRLSRVLKAEFAVVYNPSSLSTRISSDAEGAADVTVDAPVSQFLGEAGLVVQPASWQRRRLAPFVTGGIGYLRQLNDGRTLVETGMSSYVGGGLYYVRTSAHPRRLKATGVRIDLRALVLRDGVAPDDKMRKTPAVTAGVFARF
jgi:hypothetical protein